MRNFLLTFSLIIIVISAIGQNKCNCEALIDYEFIGQVYLFDKPNGQVIDSIANNLANEDFLFITITDSDKDYFKVILQLSMSEVQKTGWIKKKNYIGIYARNYSDDTILKLYSQPDKNSKTESTVKKWIPELYLILDCKGDWLKVKLTYKHTTYSGWLEKEMQCANSYTTCN
jgi:hypothetical protein